MTDPILEDFYQKFLAYLKNLNKLKNDQGFLEHKPKKKDIDELAKKSADSLMSTYKDVYKAMPAGGEEPSWLVELHNNLEDKHELLYVMYDGFQTREELLRCH